MHGIFFPEIHPLTDTSGVYHFSDTQSLFFYFIHGIFNILILNSNILRISYHKNLKSSIFLLIQLLIKT